MTAVTRAAPTEPKSVRAPEWRDRFIGSDPGLNRLRLALEAVLTIGLAICAEAVFVHFTHALQTDTHGAVLPVAEQAAVDAGNHALLVVAIMLGAVVGMIGSFSGAMETTPRRQFLLLAFLPVPMIAALTLGISLGPYRVVSLIGLVVLLSAGTYLRRFGPLGFVGGLLLFMGDFFGFFLHGVLSMSSLGWLAAEIAVGGLVALGCHFAFFAPNQRRALGRLRRSYASRARTVLALAVELVQAPGDERAARRLEGQLIRLNETALMVDAQLANPASMPESSSARGAHQKLFDAELALTNAARFAVALSRCSLPRPLAALVEQSLVALRDRKPDVAERAATVLIDELPSYRNELEHAVGVIVHRFAVSVHGLVAAREWLVPVRADDAGAQPFQTSVLLFAGFLPGSATVSATASTETGPRRVDRVLLAPYVRVAIQMGVAVGAAIVPGDLLSGRRFYWAVIAAFVTFMGTNNNGEQVRKAVNRVVGTFVGIMIGALLAHLVGTNTAWSVTVILVALFLGLYLMRVSYAFMVIGITVMVSQLYVQLDEYTNSVLVLRLEETALGAAVTVLTVLFVLPVRTGHATRIAAREHLTALLAVLEQAARRLVDPSAQVDLRAAARELDVAHQSLVATAVPTGAPFGAPIDDPRARFVATATAARNYARNLVVDAGESGSVGDEVVPELAEAMATMTASLRAVILALTPDSESGHGCYVRSAALFDLVATAMSEQNYLAPEQLALRDLQLIDGAMALAAQAVGLTVQDLDTATV